MTKPRIAVTMRSGMNGTSSCYLVNQNYVAKITAAGGIPFLCLSADEEAIEAYLDQVQGVLITGGVDIQPGLYQQPQAPETVDVDDVLDQQDLRLIAGALRRKLPILGVCRGIQVINVYFGGTLIQDIERITGKPSHRGHEDASLAERRHSVTIHAGSQLEALLGSSIKVNTYHHQACDQIGEMLHATAFSEDGIVEGLEGDNLLAVQWHPERMDSCDRLFQWLIGQAEH